MIPLASLLGQPLKVGNELHIRSNNFRHLFTINPSFHQQSCPDRTGGSGANYCYLILFNLNKKNNLGAILRSAAAFGVRLVMLVGRQGFKAWSDRCQGCLTTMLLGQLVELSIRSQRTTVRCLAGLLCCLPIRSCHRCLSLQAFCKKSGQGVVPIENAATVQEAVAALKAWPPTF